MRWLLLPALVLMLAGCSDTDDFGDQEKKRVHIELKPYASSYIEDYEGALTRDGESPTGWTPPSPYVTYDNLNAKFEGQKDLTNKSIYVFFTQDNQDPMEGTFFYKNSDKTWQLNMEVEQGDYYLYGFIPKEDATSASIVANGNYSDGAVLTINGLNTVTASDVCVLIGAKDGKSKDDDEKPDNVRLRAGSFKTNIQATSDDSPANDIFLLFDHLYASLRFNFKVDPTYAALRTIRLRQLELIAYSSSSGDKVYAKFNAEITLLKNETGVSPIVGNVRFTRNETSADVPNIPIFEGDVKLTNEATAFMGCFVPGDNTYFKLRSTYDVYDNNPAYDKEGHPILDEKGNPMGNLVRQGCQAENTIDLRRWFGNDLTTTRGHCYSLTMTVLPTYLYVLSDPDLENPTLKITN